MEIEMSPTNVLPLSELLLDHIITCKHLVKILSNTEQAPL